MCLSDLKTVILDNNRLNVVQLIVILKEKSFSLNSIVFLKEKIEGGDVRGKRLLSRLKQLEDGWKN